MFVGSNSEHCLSTCHHIILIPFTFYHSARSLGLDIAKLLFSTALGARGGEPMAVIIGRIRRERITPPEDICDLTSISSSTRESLFDLVKGGLPKVVETGGESRCKDAHTFRSGLYQGLFRVMERTLQHPLPKSVVRLGPHSRAYLADT